MASSAQESPSQKIHCQAQLLHCQYLGMAACNRLAVAGKQLSIICCSDSAETAVCSLPQTCHAMIALPISSKRKASPCGLTIPVNDLQNTCCPQFGKEGLRPSQPLSMACLHSSRQYMYCSTSTAKTAANTTRTAISKGESCWQ